MRDVIVLGAGPAGSAASKLLADAGLDVLLVERAALPRNKSCSGSLIQQTLRSVERIFESPVPPSATCTPTRTAGFVLVDENGTEHVTDQEGLNVWRAPCDAWLTGVAVKAGAHLAQKTGGRLLGEAPDGLVEVSLRSPRGRSLEHARYVVDCRGIAAYRQPGQRPDTPRPIVTYQTFHHGQCALDERYFYGFLQKGLSSYDAWLNVKDGNVVIGSAAATPSDARRYHGRFMEYLAAHHGLIVNDPLRSETWAMPAVRPGCPLQLGTGRVLACGEAAGFLNPMGEGISSALASGASAARAIIAYRSEPQAVQEAYRKATRILHGYMLRQWDHVGRLCPRFAGLVLR